MLWGLNHRPYKKLLLDSDQSRMTFSPHILFNNCLQRVPLCSQILHFHFKTYYNSCFFSSYSRLSAFFFVTFLCGFFQPSQRSATSQTLKQNESKKDNRVINNIYVFMPRIINYKINIAMRYSSSIYQRVLVGRVL